MIKYKNIMITWFCPFCWHEINKDDSICPFCEKSLEEFQHLSYEEKLILSLDNPISENKLLSIALLGKIKSTKAFEKLFNMLLSSNNTIESIEILKALIEIDKEKTIQYVSNKDIINKNTVLKRTFENLI